METFSALLAICAGNSPVTGEFPTQRPVTRSFDFFFEMRLNKQLSKLSWGWCFETPSCSFWSHCNDVAYIIAVTLRTSITIITPSHHPSLDVVYCDESATLDFIETCSHMVYAAWCQCFSDIYVVLICVIYLYTGDLPGNKIYLPLCYGGFHK